MRTNRATSLAVLATVVVGIIGFGPGRADAAKPTRVTRSSRGFTGFLAISHLLQTPLPNFRCDISGADTRSVTANVGTTAFGAGRSWTCASGSQKISLSYVLINSAAPVPRLSEGTHSFAVSYTPDGTNNFNCKTFNRSSNLVTVVDKTFATTETANSVLTQVQCADLLLTASASFTEGWSAS